MMSGPRPTPTTSGTWCTRRRGCCPWSRAMGRGSHRRIASSGCLRISSISTGRMGPRTCAWSSCPRRWPLHLPEPRDDRLLAVTKLVEEDLANPVSLAELGRQVGASERTLTRLFQQETGMTVRQWRAELRVHRALLLLADGLSVYDTAAE